MRRSAWTEAVTRALQTEPSTFARGVPPPFSIDGVLSYRGFVSALPSDETDSDINMTLFPVASRADLSKTRKKSKEKEKHHIRLGGGLSFAVLGHMARVEVWTRCEVLCALVLPERRLQYGVDVTQTHGVGRYGVFAVHSERLACSSYSSSSLLENELDLLWRAVTLLPVLPLRGSPSIHDMTCMMFFCLWAVFKLCHA